MRQITASLAGNTKLKELRIPISYDDTDNDPSFHFQEELW